MKKSTQWNNTSTVGLPEGDDVAGVGGLGEGEGKEEKEIMMEEEMTRCHLHHPPTRQVALPRLA